MERFRLTAGVAWFFLGACATAAVEVASAPAEETAQPAQAAPALPPAVTPLQAAARRQSPAGTAHITHLARGQNAYLGKLELGPGAEIPEHQDATEEYVHVLSGGGTITIEGQAHEVAAGTTIYMPAEARVSFKNGAEPTVALQVFAGPEPASKYDEWVDPDATLLQRPKPRG